MLTINFLFTFRHR